MAQDTQVKQESEGGNAFEQVKVNMSSPLRFDVILTASCKQLEDSESFSDNVSKLIYFEHMIKFPPSSLDLHCNDVLAPYAYDRSTFRWLQG